MDWSKMSPEQLAQIPAGVPPRGVIPNLVNPPNAGNYVIIANSIFVAMMITFVALRFYVVLKIKKKMGADDWMVVVSVIGICYYFVVVCLAIRVAKFGTHMYNLSVLHFRTRDVALIGFLTNGPPHLIWPWVKTTFFLMYLQLFRPLTWLRRCVYFGLAVVWVWYVAMCIAQISITAPPRGHGWVESFATPRYLQTFKICVPTAYFGLASDLYIMVLPLVAISHLRLSRLKRIGVAAMFTTGFTCCVASTVSIYFQTRLYENANDFTFYVVFIYLAYTLEVCVAISISCMPSLARLHKDKTGAKVNSVAASLGFPFRSFRKSTSFWSNDSSKGSNSGMYPKTSSSATMEDGSVLGSQLHEKSFTECEPTPPTNQTHNQSLPKEGFRLSVNISQSDLTSLGRLFP